jgi:membrane dipeptidase
MKKTLMSVGVALAAVTAAITAQGPNRPAQKPRASESIEARAARVQREAIVIDTHIDTTGHLERSGWAFTDRHDPGDGHVDLPRMKEGGVTGAFFAIDGLDQVKGPEIVEPSLAGLDALRSLAERMPDKVMLCLTAADVRRAKQSGKMALLIGVEGGHMIHDSLATLRIYARLGARYMTLTHFVNTSWADSSGEPPAHNGLTDFGRQVVREMNRLGMMVDISHVSDKTFYDALETSTAPVFASHSSCRVLASHVRNMTDDMIKALAAKGGVIQINFHAPYLDDAYAQAAQQLQPEVVALRKELEAKYPGPENVAKREEEIRTFQASRLPKVSWLRIVEHIDHAVKLVGADHVGIGSDMDGAVMPEGMEDCSHLPRITEELLRRGYSEADVKKILGGNTLRVMEQVEAAAKQLRERPGPSAAP